MHKIGLKLWSCNTDFYYDEAIRLYKDGIYDYIELYVVPGTLNTLEKWKKLKIPFIIHNAHFAQGFNLAKSEKEESNRKIYDQTKQFADELNAKYIIFHGGIEGNIKETVRQLKSFNDHRVLIENKPLMGLPGDLGSLPCRGFSIEEIKEVIDTVGCGFCFDFGHCICSANAQKLDVYEYCKEFIDTFDPTMYHLTDFKDIKSIYDSHLHLGDGQLNLEKVISMIADSKCVTLETCKNSKNNLDDFVNDCKIFRQYAK